MARNNMKESNSRVAQYPDIVPTHPDMTKETLREQIEKHIKEDESLTEWPDV